jgi:hypothetical protein
MDNIQQTIDAPVPLKSVKSKISNTIDDILTRFILSEPTVPELEKNWATKKSWMRTPEFLWGCDYHLLDEVAELSVGEGRYYLAPDEMEAEFSDAMWPIDIGQIKIWPATVRGKTRTIRPKMVMASSAYMHKHEWSPQNEIFGQFGNDWVQICDGVQQVAKGKFGYGSTRRVGEEALDAHRGISIAFSGALSERYEWHAAFGFHPNGPRILIPTSPSGCLRLFQDREKEEGQTRRAALKHWVNQHYRAHSENEDEIIYVREHLRGNTRFIWRGVDVEVLVSAFDLEKNELFARNAAEWRSSRKHNQIRLRA